MDKDDVIHTHSHTHSHTHTLDQSSFDLLTHRKWGKRIYNRAKSNYQEEAMTIKQKKVLKRIIISAILTV